MYQNVHIVDFYERPEGTYLKVLVPHISLTDDLKHCKINDLIKGDLRLDDPNCISADQRKKAYATIADIGNHLGYPPEIIKEYMKVYYCCNSGENNFSLSNCNRTLARHFISYLLDFALEWGIQLQDTGLNRSDDTNAYLYSCLKRKRCALCGGNGEIHHITAIGAGHDRKTVDDSKHLKMCLCRKHHTEVHKIGVDTFCKKYKVYGILFNKKQEE